MPKTIAGPLRQHVWLCLSLSCALSCFAQSNSGTVRGTVADPSGAVISGAVVSVDNPVSHYSRNTVTDNQGKFEFDNLPYNNYHLTVVAKGFQAAAEDINVRSSVPMEVKFGLTVGQEKQTVTVEAGEDLVESTPVTHTDVDRGLFEKVPLESQSSELSSVVTLTVPGISADSNGLFHSFGDHASNSFALDDEPITDHKARSSRIKSRSTPSSRWR